MVWSDNETGANIARLENMVTGKCFKHSELCKFVVLLYI